MSYGLVLICKVVSTKEAGAISPLLDANRDGDARWPTGLVMYTGPETSSGVVVTEVWATRDLHEQFLAVSLGRVPDVIDLTAPSPSIEVDAVRRLLQQA